MPLPKSFLPLPNSLLPLPNRPRQGHSCIRPCFPLDRHPSLELFLLSQHPFAGDADILFINDKFYGPRSQTLRYSAEVNDFDGSYTLKILQPRLEDGGRFKCVIGKTDSAIISLTVIGEY